jgi:nitrile hydratase accessory protein
MRLHETCTTDAAAPSFDHEWQRRAFGLAVALSEFGHYEWSEFQQSLIDTIAEWEAEPEAARGQWSYYDHWVIALDRVVTRRRLLTEPAAVDRANHAT